MTHVTNGTPAESFEEVYPPLAQFALIPKAHESGSLLSALIGHGVDTDADASDDGDGEGVLGGGQLGGGERGAERAEADHSSAAHLQLHRRSLQVLPGRRHLQRSSGSLFPFFLFLRA